MDEHIKIGRRLSLYGSGPVRISIDDRRRHMLVSGRSGTGKSTLLANLFAQDANSGRGALLIDPHGELAEEALDLIPPRRIRKTIYLNPSDANHPIGFNVLDGVRPEERAARADAIVGAFKSVWSSSWGARLEYILYNTVAALLEIDGATLLWIPKMLTNANFREAILPHLHDPRVAEFWREEFPMFDKKFGAEATVPVLNKIGQVLASPVVRNIIGQSQSRINPRYLMDNNYLIIANLSKGLLGEQHANLLGSLLIATFGSAALSRANIRAHERKDFAIIIDEFPNYTTSSFESVLSEARKYHVSLILAHQYLDQMTDDVRSAVLGNIGSVVVFRTGAQDSAVFERELTSISANQLTDTDNFRAWCRVLDRGTISDAFLLQTSPPPKSHGHAEKVIRHSRQNYAIQRATIEERVRRFLSHSPQQKTSSPNYGRRRARW